jgi:hypothetical protein
VVTSGEHGKVARIVRVSARNFRDDRMFPRIERVVADLLAEGNVVTPVDVLIGMGLLRPEHLKDWRFGRVPYLERVINCNLTRLSPAASPALPCPRSQPQALRDDVHALRQGPQATAALQQDRRRAH